MADGDVVWKIINHGFCSFRYKLQTHNFCKNEYNVTGFCNAKNCPIANARYATVRDIDGTLFLFVKTIERAHSPKNLWEKVRLSSNYRQALAQIDEKLQYWPRHMKHKCKLRMTKLTQVLIRMRRIALHPKTRELVRVNKKVERREKARAKKAESAAMLDQSIKKELFARLLKGTYATEVVNLDEGLQRILRGEQPEETEAETEREMEEETEAGDMESDPTEYVADYGSGDEDEDGEGGVPDIEDLAKKTKAKGKKAKATKEKGKKKATTKKRPTKPRVEIEFEEEREQQMDSLAGSS